MLQLDRPEAPLMETLVVVDYRLDAFPRCYGMGNMAALLSSLQQLRRIGVITDFFVASCEGSADVKVGDGEIMGGLAW